jgi:hypothetical protein
MQIEFAQSDNVDVPATAVAGILHDLCQPLTALECSLELALLPCSVTEARSLTSSALQAARRLHALANQARAVEGLCGRYRRPRVLSLGELAATFGLASSADDADKNIYIDVDGLREAFDRLTGNALLHGGINCARTVVRIVLVLDATERGLDGNPDASDHAIPLGTLISALIEHLGGRVSFSKNKTVLEFLTH